MTRDPIVDEIRRTRQELAARFNYDLRAIIIDAQKRQRARGKKVVSFARVRKKRPA